MDEVLLFLKEHEEKVRPLLKELQLAYWNATISGKKEDYDKVAELEISVKKIHNNKEDFEKVKKFRNLKTDSLTSRQLKLIYYDFLGNQGPMELLEKISRKSNEIENKFNTFRAKALGKELTDNQVNEILKTENDSRILKEVWEASKEIGPIVEKDMLELVGLRNQLAKYLGFKNYYHMSLELNEQKEDEILALFKKLDELTKSVFKKLKDELDDVLSKRYKIGKSEMMPWHYHDRFFQEDPKVFQVNLDNYYKDKDVAQISNDFYNSIGLDISDVLDRSDLYEKPGKNQHAYCIDIDREGDVRILQNIKDNERWMSTTLHELGHANYNKYINKQLPFFLRTHSHILCTEAIAMLFGRLSSNAEWMKDALMMDIGGINIITRKILQLKLLIFSRWCQVMLHFERSLYENPSQDLNKLWWDLVKDYQFLNNPQRNRPDWAAKIHICTAPVYYHNYMMGELFASQIHHKIKELLKKDNYHFSYYNRPEIGSFLKEKIFAYGAEYIWKELIEKATGESLNPKYFVEQFA